MIYTIDYLVIQPYKLHWSIGITQALTTFGIPNKSSQAFIFHKSMQILHSKKSEDWVLRKLFRIPILPSKFWKKTQNFFADHICHQFNEAICSSKFPATFKFANVTPIISKIFEKLICRQLSQHFNNICSKFQCDFRQGFNAQHCLLLMIDKWKKL